jgi:hypothetical protein
LEPGTFKLGLMTLQSSFLLRCSLGSTQPGKPYFVKHVQTGTEFRAGTLAEATQWMSEQNERFLAYVTTSLPDPNSAADEDLV